MDLPIVLSHKTAWLYHNVARLSEPLSRASSLYDEDSLASEAGAGCEPAQIGTRCQGAEGFNGSWDRYRLSGCAWYSTRRARSYRHAR